MSKSLKEMRVELAEATERVTQGTFLVDVLEAAGAHSAITVALRRYQDEMAGLSALREAYEAEQVRVGESQKRAALDAFESTGVTSVSFDTGTRASIRATYNYNNNAVLLFIKERHPDLLRYETDVSVDKKQLKRDLPASDWAEVERLRELKSVSVTLRQPDDNDDDA